MAFLNGIVLLLLLQMFKSIDVLSISSSQFPSASSGFKLNYRHSNAPLQHHLFVERAAPLVEKKELSYNLSRLAAAVKSRMTLNESHRLPSDFLELVHVVRVRSNVSRPVRQPFRVDVVLSAGTRC